MDRNTIIGLVLIGLILTVFTVFNQPDEPKKKDKAKTEQAEQKKKAENKSAEDKSEEIAANLVPKLDDEGEQLIKDSMLVYLDTITNQDTLLPMPTVNEDVAEADEDKKVESMDTVPDEFITLESDRLIVEFNKKGGQISSVRLKEFETYKDFAKKDGKIDPLTLFKSGDGTNGLAFPYKGKNVETWTEQFEVKEQTDSKIVFALEKGEGTIEYIYEIAPDSYDVTFDINMEGFGGKVTPQNVIYNWDVAYRKTERLFSEQRRVSTICYDQKEEGFSYLSENVSDDLEAEDDINWVCYKQSYFSTFIRPDKPFAKSGTELSVDVYDEDHERKWRNLKDYKSALNLNLNNVDNASTRLNFYFGPNDYKVLREYGNDYDKILNYGWGLFRWINIYAIQPLFAFLTSTGMGIGLAILLLTIVIKSALMPIQWKMYTSSAKMRILKPEIEELNQKYPNKEDGMKKQMEMMTLYRESGASPLSGCVPMLIQMPILLSVFRFFPSTFDLRQKGFLWAEDLSSYDSVWDFGVYIWPYGDHVSLFTLLMAGTTLIYTFINSSNMQQPTQEGMPNMKYIMYFFPIMMIFFFNNYSSGLSYYYFISTLMSILIMILIKRFFVDEEKLKAKMATRKANAGTGNGKAPKGKSKFQERLEKMQKAQQEQMKARQQQKKKK